MLPTDIDLSFLLPPEQVDRTKEGFLFYALSYHNQQQIMTACLTKNQALSDYLEDWLWSYQPYSFLAHRQAGSINNLPQILIHHELSALKECSVIINLTHKPFASFNSHTHHVELVNDCEKATYRKIYQAYKKQGLHPNTRTLH